MRKPTVPVLLAAGLLASLLAKSAEAGVNRWTPANKGLPGTRIVSLVADPSSPGRLYASTEAGIVTSGNAGGSWAAVNPGIGNSKLALAPGRFYAANTGTNTIWRSTDGGITWVQRQVGPLRFLSALAVDPSNPSTVYVAGYNGIAKSVDSGDTWALINTGLVGPSNQYFNTLVIDSTAPATLYLGAFYGVFKSTDGGANWRREDLNGEVLSLAIEPSDPNTLYAGTVGPSVHKSINGGATWESLGFIGADFVDLAIDSSGLYAASSYGGVLKTANGGQSWTPIDDGLPNLPFYELVLDPFSPGTLYAGTDGAGVFDYETVSPAAACVPGPTTLCLNDNRFKVQVSWRAPSLGTSGVGMATALTSDTGHFWFFSANNIELTVKVVDGRAVNDFFWAFFGALSDVEYTVTVTDTVTGVIKTYFNPAGRLASVADTAAFRPAVKQRSSPAVAGAAAREEADSGGTGTAAPPVPAESLSRAEGACAAGPTTLCLNGGRFQVRVTWRVPSQGSAGVGVAVPLTNDTGYLWFFSGNNVELVIKVLDGRSFNGNFWVFYGALSDVEYTITVTDTQTGAIRTYFNPSGQLASVADTAAF